MNRLACVITGSLAFAGCALDNPDPAAPGADPTAAPTEEAAPAAASAIQHVFVIAMENHAASSIYGNTTHAPYINNTLLPMYGRATNFIDVLPQLNSEPHYVWMEAGTNAFSDHTFTTDNNPSSSNSTASTAHLSTQITAAGATWRSYQEGINSTTGTCPIAASGEYAPKHDPFIFFRDVSGSTPSKTNAFCAAHHKPLTSLATDLANNAVAAYNFITPNLCNDMHDSCSPVSDPIKQGDTWLSQNMPALISYANAHQGVVWIVWDEPEGSTGMIPLIVVGPNVKPNFASAVKYTHGSIVKSVEAILALPTLSKVSADNTFTDFFNAGFFP
ncbi:MAG TPA: alkaline phosphatase family protein [Kofleriaceae bacterium]|jgi:phospholipase C|nr:alkaline phosphatase family protein [Kofleriaceae bacterium]